MLSDHAHRRLHAASCGFQCAARKKRAEVFLCPRSVPRRRCICRADLARTNLRTKPPCPWPPERPIREPRAPIPGPTPPKLLGDPAPRSATWGDPDLPDDQVERVSFSGLRRLTSREYQATIDDLLLTTAFDASSQFPTDSLTPFDNDYDVSLLATASGRAMA